MGWDLGGSTTAVKSLPKLGFDFRIFKLKFAHDVYLPSTLISIVPPSPIHQMGIGHALKNIAHSSATVS